MPYQLRKSCILQSSNARRSPTGNLHDSRGPKRAKSFPNNAPADFRAHLNLGWQYIARLKPLSLYVLDDILCDCVGKVVAVGPRYDRHFEIIVTERSLRVAAIQHAKRGNGVTLGQRTRLANDP